MIEAKVDSIRVSLVTQQRVVILKDLTMDRYLPIWIGPFEADAIAFAIQEVPIARPLTHDLLRTVIQELGANVTHVLINDLRDETYYARIVLDVQGRHAEIDCRSSDAIALAVRVHTKIYVDDAVMDRAGVTLDGESANATVESRSGHPEEVGSGSPKPDDERLSVFRDFINSLDVDDPDRREDREGRS
ncbi:MAG TPA: bifunctional nuclease family protein [Chloroflexia bacterium]|nr:bifunctional nuclease family protein [Chloroflexia bacterium]